MLLLLTARFEKLEKYSAGGLDLVFAGRTPKCRPMRDELIERFEDFRHQCRGERMAKSGCFVVPILGSSAVLG